MLLADPQSTPYDLGFRLFRTSVRVHPLFWLIAVMLGWGYTQSRHPVTGNVLGDLALWVACVFVSILLHEFGHVFAFRAFGNDAHIVLHGMGGLAIADGGSPHRWQRIIVSAAGPAIQLALWAVLVGLIWAGVLPRPLEILFADASWLPSLDKEKLFERFIVRRDLTQTPLELIVGMLLWINLVWPIFNLLPIWPLDGGQITREVAVGVSRNRGVVVSLWISIIVCAILAINELLGMNKDTPAPLSYLSRYLQGGSQYNAFFLGLLAITSFQALQAEKNRGQSWDDQLPWDR